MDQKAWISIKILVHSNILIIYWQAQAREIQEKHFSKKLFNWEMEFQKNIESV